MSEAIAATVRDFDLQADAVILGESATRRSIPLPRELITTLTAVHALRDLPGEAELWPVDRITAFRWIKKIMREAGIPESRANTRTLRHTRARQWAEQGIPMTTLHVWLGNTNLKHTERYYQELK